MDLPARCACECRGAGDIAARLSAASDMACRDGILLPVAIAEAAIIAALLLYIFWTSRPKRGAGRNGGRVSPPPPGGDLEEGSGRSRSFKRATSTRSMLQKIEGSFTHGHASPARAKQLFETRPVCHGRQAWWRRPITRQTVHAKRPPRAPALSSAPSSRHRHASTLPGAGRPPARP